MPASSSADLTARLLLRYASEPSRDRIEAAGADASLVDTDVVIRLALGRDPGLADAASTAAGFGALRAAAIRYMREVFFRPDASPYQTLGLARDASPEAIRERFRLVMLLVHPDRQPPGATWPASCAAQANRAYAILRDPQARAAFDREESAREAATKAAREAAGAKLRTPAGPAERHTTRVRPWRPPPPRPVLPEWLTARVGGWVRAHPAGAAFAALGASAVLVMGGVALWETESASLVRAPRPPAAVAVAPRPGITAERPAPTLAEPGEVPSETADGEAAATPPATPAARLAAATVLPEPGASRPAAATVVPEPGASRPAAATVLPEPGAPRLAVTAAHPVTPPLHRRVPVEAPAAAPVRTGAAPPMAAPAPIPTPNPTFALPAPAATVPIARPVVPPARVAAVDVAAASPAPAASAALATSPAVPAPGQAPTSEEIETFFARFIAAYEGGRADVVASMFHPDAQVNERSGRAAIRDEYDAVFRESAWRRMQITRIHWRRAGDAARAQGEAVVTIGWRDGREVVRRFPIDLALVRSDGRVVIMHLMRGPSAP